MSVSKVNVPDLSRDWDEVVDAVVLDGVVDTDIPLDAGLEVGFDTAAGTRSRGACLSRRRLSRSRRCLNYGRRYLGLSRRCYHANVTAITGRDHGSDNGDDRLGGFRQRRGGRQEGGRPRSRIGSNGCIPTMTMVMVMAVATGTGGSTKSERR